MEVARWEPSGPLDLSVSIARLSRHGRNLVDVVSGDHLYRTTTTGAIYRVRQLDNGSIEVGAERDLDIAVDESRYRLGQTLPAEPLREVAERVPPVADQLLHMPGYRPPINPSTLEVLVSSICAQQVNLRWAAVTLGRVVERFGVPQEMAGVRVWKFPEPERLAAVEPSELRTLQLSSRKSQYIVGVARAVAAGDLEGLADVDSEGVIRRLVALRGVGRWTADWFLARCLARPDAVAAGDLGVRKVVSRYVARVDEVLPEADVRAITGSWGNGGNWAIHLLLERWGEEHRQQRRKSGEAVRGP